VKHYSRREAIITFGIAATSIVAAAAAPAMAAKSTARWWRPTTAMDAMTAIRTRRSVRSFTNEDVSEEQVRALLGAAMSAPSAGNEQPWEFVVVRNKATLGKVGAINRFAQYAASAPLGVLACGNLHWERHKGYWIEDVSAACQNMLLAAHAIGLGAVWTGIYPQTERVEAFRQLVALPEYVVPMALIVVGHPKATPEPEDRFDAARIHRERWQG